MMAKNTRCISLVITSLLLSASSVAANQLVFYEGNGCRQNVVCTISATAPANVNLKKASCSNDETRSLLLKAGTPAGTRIHVFDDPNGGKGDDWARITVNPQKSLDRDVCVASFETSQSKIEGLVKIEAHRHNGLDGKVSHISVEPPEDW